MLLKGKKRKDTVCIALVEEGLDDSSIRMSKVSKHDAVPLFCERIIHVCDRCAVTMMTTFLFVSVLVL